MHHVGTNASERRYIPLVLAGVAIALAYCGNRILSHYHVSVPWWVSPPSVMALYGGIYELFDRWLWKWDLLHRLHMVQVPVLEGKWVGHVRSSFGDDFEPKDVKVEILQRWSRIVVQLTTEESRSVSKTGNILIEELGPLLTYEYLNEPSPSSEQLNIHRGTARLRLTGRNGQQVLEGHYYTGKDRQNIGELVLQREI